MHQSRICGSRAVRCLGLAVLGTIALGIIALGTGASRNVWSAEPPAPQAAAPKVADTKSSPTGTTAAKSVAEEAWDVIYLGKSRAGFTRAAIKPFQREGAELILTESDMTLVVKRFGQELKSKVHVEVEETAAGDMLRFEFESQNPPASATVQRGRVEQDELVIATTTDGKTSERRVPWNKDIKSPAYQDRLLKQNPLKPGETRKFKMFLPELGRVSDIELKADKVVEEPLLGDRKEKLLKVQVSQSALPGIVSQIYLDQKGEAQKTTVGFLQMATYRVPREEALQEVAGAELDVGISTLIKVAIKGNPHQEKSIVYRVTIRREDPLAILPTGTTQAVKKVEPEVADLTVTAVRGSDSPAPQNPPAIAAEFKEPTRYLQSDDARVIEHMRAAVGDETDPWKRAVRMERYVFEKLNKKNFSTALASAGEVARNLEGDCTEHACLLAAMARAAGVPSRIAVGLVYVKSLGAFGGHMWTEVFVNGRWVPVDATLGRGGIGAGHIKLADSSFHDDGATPVAAFLPLVTILEKLQIEVREEKQ